MNVDIILPKIMDYRNDIVIIIAVHDASVITKRVRSKGPTGYRELVKPKCVEDYNRHMGGVDRADQLCSYYHFTHRAMKWYIRLYHHVREVALVNAHILFKESTGISMPTPDFRNKVVAGLLGRALQDAPPLPPRELLGVPARLSGRHFLGQREGTKPDCKVCSSRKRGPMEGSNKKTSRRQTPFFCKTCPEQPALCPVLSSTTPRWSTSDGESLCE